MRALRGLCLAAAWLAALLFALTGVLLTWEVVARYFFNAPTTWAAELSQMCLIWGTLMAMAWALQARRHIRIVAVTQLMGDRARAGAETFAMLAVAAFAAVTLWKGTEIAWDSFTRGRTTGTMLDLPSWIAEAAVPAGFALLLAAALTEAFEAFRGRIPEEGAHGE